uniref:Major capsid protein n=1 Tax=Myoviridae sp. ctgEf1 TaxID=2827699 RepID=A0A8S5SKU2_9CAUD|nr:MAG TPA: major capsid protein [Myoviridae sp. ctgEf1]
MAEKVKKTALELKTEISKSVGENEERRIRFVASSVNEDRHYEKVDVASLRLPLKQGGEIRAGAIPTEGVNDLVDIPLILNHSGDVRDTIGSVRSAFYENGELIFEAGISKREIAQEMLLLLEEGHLSNAFSITMSDFDYNFESETISNAEIIEVSLVFRGANREARLLAVKSLKGDEMSQEKETPEVLKKEATTTVYPEIVADDEPEVEQAKNSIENNNYNEEKEEEMDKELAKDAISKAAPSQTMKSSSNYLETREAMNDYAKILEKFAGANANEVKKAWADHVAHKGISNVEALLPGAMVSAISDGIEKSGTIWNILNKTGLTVRRIDAETAGARAQGHKRGTTKKETTLTFTDRVIRAGFIYDYLKLNKEDIVENRDTGALVKFVLETLPKRIITELERAVVIGDGRNGDGDDKINSFVSILEDAKNNVFATEYTPVKDEPLYKSIVKAAANIVAEGDVYLVMSKSAKAELKLSETKSGALVFPLGGDIAGTLEVKEIFTPSWFAPEGVQAVIFVGDAYETVGDNSIEAYTNFSLSQNKQEYLQEIYAGGALTKVKSGVVIKNAA